MWHWIGRDKGPHPFRTQMESAVAQEMETCRSKLMLCSSVTRPTPWSAALEGMGNMGRPPRPARRSLLKPRTWRWHSNELMAGTPRGRVQTSAPSSYTMRRFPGQWCPSRGPPTSLDAQGVRDGRGLRVHASLQRMLKTEMVIISRSLTWVRKTMLVPVRLILEAKNTVLRPLQLFG